MKDTPPDLRPIRARVREKSESYQRYNFSRRHNDLLKAFFDLAQEYESIGDFYRICVTVPLEMADLACRLYVAEEISPDGTARLVCDSAQGLVTAPDSPRIRLSHDPVEEEGFLILPVYDKPPSRSRPGMRRRGKLLGMLALGPDAAIGGTDRFFFAKYCNRIGYNLHNRLMADQNERHLHFIKTLVMDIEHNVIVPNMYFKHLFNRLGAVIDELEYAHDHLLSACQECSHPDERNALDGRIGQVIRDLRGRHQDMVKHHAHMSLFLESLLRREHFESGRLVLHPRRCLVEQKIIIPQLEHYAARLEQQGVTVERPRNMFHEEFPLMVDMGLLSQVYANLFSNAVKYTREVLDHRGRPRRAMTYGREIVHDFPVPGQRGIKFNVFTTGPHISPEDRAILFEEGTRGSNAGHAPGSGHGLAFVRHVIELHGGKVGVETVPQGNNFYFILPLPDDHAGQEEGNGSP